MGEETSARTGVASWPPARFLKENMLRCWLIILSATACCLAALVLARKEYGPTPSAGPEEANEQEDDILLFSSEVSLSKLDLLLVLGFGSGGVAFLYTTVASSKFPTFLGTVGRG